MNWHNPEEFSRTAISLAASKGYHEFVRVLLEHGADPNAINGTDHKTALHAAAINDTPEIMKLLINEGGNVDSKDSDMSTPLHAAAYSGCVSTIRVLLECDATLDAFDIEGNTPLHEAACAGMLDNIVELMKHGASSHVMNKKGKTPVQMAPDRACRMAMSERDRLREMWPCVKLLYVGHDEMHCILSIIPREILVMIIRFSITLSAREIRLLCKDLMDE